MAKAVDTNQKKQTRTPPPAKKAAGGSRPTKQAAAPTKGGGKVAKEDAKKPGRWTRARSQARQSRAVKNAKTEKRGFGKFLKDVRVEMGKVTWPTRKELIQSTIVVIVAVVIMSAYTGALDFVFSRLVNFILP